MAKSNESFDRYFKEKLEGHQEKPSTLAWERLESQLPKSKKTGVGFWWAIAASVSALVMVAYLNWPSDQTLPEENLIAQNVEEQSTQELSEESAEVISGNSGIEISGQEESTNATSENQKIEISSPKTTKEKTTSQSSKSQKREAQVDSFITEASEKSTQKVVEPVVIPEANITEPEINLPELKTPELSKTVAEAKPEATNEPLYRVSIYSDGIKKGDPVEKNLITELGKTVGQVEGLLGKVDEGFAEIQDKKDNLFANLTARREKADEKP